MFHDSTGRSAARDRSGLTEQTTAHPSRRAFLAVLGKAAGVLIATPLLAQRLRAQTSANVTADAPTGTAANAAPIAMKVYKDPDCGCCKEWIKHIQAAGFVVTHEDTANMNAIKNKLGVPSALWSCHTAVVGDYLVEGHVPADVVQKLLKEKPSARGLAVPGMPQGSPGMEGPTKDKYNVMMFDRLGKATVYASR